MKVGSLVELIRDDWDSHAYKYDSMRGVVFPVKGKIYTIREIESNQDRDYIYLEEIVNPQLKYISGMGESCWNITRFREVLPPMKINLEEIIFDEIDEPI